MIAERSSITSKCSRSYLFCENFIIVPLRTLIKEPGCIILKPDPRCFKHIASEKISTVSECILPSCTSSTLWNCPRSELVIEIEIIDTLTRLQGTSSKIELLPLHRHIIRFVLAQCQQFVNTRLFYLKTKRSNSL